MRLKYFAFAILLAAIIIGILSACQNSASELTNPNSNPTPEPVPNPEVNLDVSFNLYDGRVAPFNKYSTINAGNEAIFVWSLESSEEKVFRCSVDVQGDGTFEYVKDDCRSSIRGNGSPNRYEYRYTYQDSDKDKSYQPKLLVQDEKGNSYEKEIKIKILDPRLDIDLEQSFLVEDNKYYIWVRAFWLYDLSKIQAELNGQKMDMKPGRYCTRQTSISTAPSCYGGYIALFDLEGSAPGEKTIKVILEDVTGYQKIREFPINYNLPPTFSIEDGLVANPTLSLDIPCTDDNPSECTITVGLVEDIDDVYGYPVQEFTQKGRFRLDLDLSDYLENGNLFDTKRDGEAAIVITATDSSQQSVRLERQIFVIADNPNITPILKVPGQIEDLSSEAVLYSNNNSRPNFLLLTEGKFDIPERDRSSSYAESALFYQNRSTKAASKNLLPKGGDLADGYNNGSFFKKAYLFDGGVILEAVTTVVSTDSTQDFMGIYEWREGQSESSKLVLNRPFNIFWVNRSYALLKDSENNLLLRNLSTQTNQVVDYAYDPTFPPALTENGTVVFVNTAGEVRTWRNGTLTQITDDVYIPIVYSSPVYPLRFYENDIAYTKANASGDVAIAVYSSGRETIRTPYYPELMLGDYLNDWALYSRKSGLNGTQTWFLDPQGNETQLTFLAQNNEIVNWLTPTGEYQIGNRRIAPGKPERIFYYVDNATDIVWLDGDWTQILGGQVFLSK